MSNEWLIDSTKQDLKEWIEEREKYCKKESLTDDEKEDLEVIDDMIRYNISNLQFLGELKKDFKLIHLRDILEKL